MIEAIVTDIEGTTTSLSFVKDVLFPYAREQLADYVRNRRDDPKVREILASVSMEAGKPLDAESTLAQLCEWMDQDKKVTSLKALQGLIWDKGYCDGAFLGHIYNDAARNIRGWAERGFRLYIYSSGSVQAQKLLFSHTEFGDLTTCFSGYFDTRTGGKREAESYERIAHAIGVAPERILFLSDVGEELDAAARSGLKTCWLVREGDVDPEAAHCQVPNFDRVNAIFLVGDRIFVG